MHWQCPARGERFGTHADGFKSPSILSKSPAKHHVLQHKIHYDISTTNISVYLFENNIKKCIVCKLTVNLILPTVYNLLPVNTYTYVQPEENWKPITNRAVSKINPSNPVFCYICQ